MAYKADRSTSPTARLILLLLQKKTSPQSAIDISDETHSSYWTVRTLCKKMVDDGVLTCRVIRKAPHYALASTEGTKPSESDVHKSEAL